MGQADPVGVVGEPPAAGAGLTAASPRPGNSPPAGPLAHHVHATPGSGAATPLSRQGAVLRDVTNDASAGAACAASRNAAL